MTWQELRRIAADGIFCIISFPTDEQPQFCCCFPGLAQLAVPTPNAQPPPCRPTREYATSKSTAQSYTALTLVFSLKKRRQKLLQVVSPVFSSGSQLHVLTVADTHRWTVFLTSATSPPPKVNSSNEGPPVDMDELPGGADDLSYLIKKVTFRLHETYPNPSRGQYDIF